MTTTETRNPTPEGSGRVADPRGVRVSLAPSSMGAGLPPIVIEPPAIPVAPAGRIAGRGLLGGTTTVPGQVPIEPAAIPGSDARHLVLVDGQVVDVALVRLDGERAVLVRGGRGAAVRSKGKAGSAMAGSARSVAGSRERILMLPPVPDPDGGGRLRREIVVGGWRVEVEVESAARAALRERARRGREEAEHSGPLEVHAIIPGVVVSVSVAAGDEVVAGQQLLAVEAMKMQNELRAPRDGTISRVAVAPGRTIEVGDLLLVIT